MGNNRVSISLFIFVRSLPQHHHSGLIKDKLEQLTLLRMAIDACAGMAYLSEAGFVVREDNRGKSGKGKGGGYAVSP